ncbi:glycine/betaine ABC transporter substrate-binding protein [Oceanidesulfovibrio indonesiensis]|uniref:Glycine/betaine ABC transporter substrate-binding protein n=1 Tax=Oceanidesulfovibrio indonesiensis TaxID=54767 RepID=A0A7M3MAT7_9BACT|nr:glycine betaine ABC transporter substrate-binding protein [Oceanidesulfovibrio indonesiensis]TVM15038.1 glycine/betaine ABC transporter substrate-binding protein [Oceanidesulfovibrio indonesiensis]
MRRHIPPPPLSSLVLTLVLLALVVLTALPSPARAADPKREPLRIVYVNWSSSIASANLVRAVLEEKLGIPCRLTETTADSMWRMVAAGEADAMLSAWLPETHAAYAATHLADVDDLGPNLEGARVGLVVPRVSLGRPTTGTGLANRPLVEARSITDLKTYGEQFGHRIVGIDPEAGVMRKTRIALREYELDGWRLNQGDEQSMVKELERSIRRHERIVVTGWKPHWMFALWRLEFLEDPKDVFGGHERIHTVVRKGLEDDMPEAYGFLNRFRWTAEDMEQLMLWNRQSEGPDKYGNAQRWMRAHPDTVNAWID